MDSYRSKALFELDRAEIADVCLGKFLACAPVGKDGVWPNEVVRDVMEDLESKKYPVALILDSTTPVVRIGEAKEEVRRGSSQLSIADGQRP